MSALTQDRPYLRSVGDEPLPGYRLVAPLGQGGFGEVWKCVAPGGLQKAVKFVFDETADPDDSSLRQEYDAFLRVKGIRHPFLLTLERVELLGDELVMVMELADESMLQQFEACQASGQTGLPRRELLAYMVDIAEALDVLSGQHGLQHLDVKPANLFLMGGHVKVGDYGLVARYRRGSDGSEPKLGRGLTPKYVAPEILADRVDRRTDQYSLALVYAELLTGRFPYSGKTAKQLLVQHTSADPDLDALPECDRPAVRKALSKSPHGRFPTCLAFVKALLNDDPPGSRYLASPAVATPTPVPTPYPQSRGLSGSLAVVNTQRHNPAVTLRPGANLAAAADDLATACPELRFVGEGKAGSRGRLVRAVDPSGASKAVRILRLDGGTAVDLDELFRALAVPLPGAAQSVVFPQPRLMAVVWPADAPTLREWLTAAPPDTPSPATAVRLLAPLAAVLDGLHAVTGFGHLLLGPSSVTMSDQGVAGVTGFGVGEALRRSRSDRDWLTDHPYAAPDALAGQGSPKSDQYGLALVYLEVRRAWSADTPRGRDALPRVRWDGMSAVERAAVERALSANPADRFETCAAFLEAVRPPTATGVVLDQVRLIESVDRLAGGTSPAGQPPDPWTFADAVTRFAQGGLVTVPLAPAGKPSLCVVRQADGRYTLRFPVKLTGPHARLKLTAFQDQHGFVAVPMSDGNVLLKPRSSGRSGGAVELYVQLPADGPAAVTEMVVSGRTRSLDQGPKAVEQVAAALEQFRRAMQNADERRDRARWRTEGAVGLYPVDDELAVGAAVIARARDVSVSGFAAAVVGDPPSGHIYASFPGAGEADGWAALARIVRTVPLGGGHHLVAGRFVYAG